MPLLHLLLSCYLYLATSRARLFQLHVPSAPTLWRTWLVARIRGQGTWTAELKMPILLPNATLIGGNRVVDVTLSFSVAHNYSCATFDKTNTCTKTIDASSVLMAGSSIFGSTGGPLSVHLLLQHQYSPRMQLNQSPCCGYVQRRPCGMQHPFILNMVVLRLLNSAHQLQSPPLSLFGKGQVGGHGIMNTISSLQGHT